MENACSGKVGTKHCHTLASESHNRIRMRNFHLALYLFILLYLSACGQAQNTTPVPSATPLQSPTVLSPSVAVPSQTATRTPTAETVIDSQCKPVQAGTLTGNVTQAGKPIPNGVYVGADLEGGPNPNTWIKNGSFEMPLLARQCADGTHWVDFFLWIDHFGVAVQPDKPNMQLDIEVPPTEQITVVPGPTCPLVFGQVEGQVQVKGRPAADGTSVTARRVGQGTSFPMGVPAQDQITQRVFTKAGRYSVISIGTKCDDGNEAYLSFTLFASDVSVVVTPTKAIYVQDLVVP